MYFVISKFVPQYEEFREVLVNLFKLIPDASETSKSILSSSIVGESSIKV
jgi:hypothetical protein